MAFVELSCYKAHYQICKNPNFSNKLTEHMHNLYIFIFYIPACARVKTPSLCAYSAYILNLLPGANPTTYEFAITTLAL
jgi:hypothetical protein